MTEPEEKAECLRIMGKSHSTELEAAYAIAERLSGGADEAAKRWRITGSLSGGSG